MPHPLPHGARDVPLPLPSRHRVRLHDGTRGVTVRAVLWGDEPVAAHVCTDDGVMRCVPVGEIVTLGRPGELDIPQVPGTVIPFVPRGRVPVLVVGDVPGAVA